MDDIDQQQWTGLDEELKIKSKESWIMLFLNCNQSSYSMMDLTMMSQHGFVSVMRALNSNK